MAGAASEIESFEYPTGGPTPAAATLARLDSHVSLRWAGAAIVEGESLDVARPSGSFGAQTQQGGKHE